MQGTYMDNSRQIVKEQGNNSSFFRFGKLAVDFLYPPSCINCHTPIIKEQSLCAKCWGQLRAINEPFCPILGIPFTVDLGPNALSAQAISKPPIFDRARSAFIYCDISAAIISRLKYGDRPELAKYCARLMANIINPIFEDNPLLVPVPLHWSRQWARRYNQAGQIAAHLAKIFDLQLEVNLVKRIKRTKRQVGLSSKEREKNVANAFLAASNAAKIAANRRIVIVDDVITTGATLNGVAKALKKVGINKIDAVSFARVVKS